MLEIRNFSNLKDDEEKNKFLIDVLSNQTNVLLKQK